MSINQWIGNENVVDIQREYYSAKKKNEMLKFLSKQIELEIIILSK